MSVFLLITLFVCIIGLCVVLFSLLVKKLIQLIIRKSKLIKPRIVIYIANKKKF